MRLIRLRVKQEDLTYIVITFRCYASTFKDKEKFERACIRECKLQCGYTFRSYEVISANLI